MSEGSNNPLVSIGVPAFKGAHFAEALRSIKNQTYRNIEVIVQDDASPDDLKAIFDAEVGDDQRFSYARNDTNTAPYFVRNWQKTIDKAHGEFFVLAGDDDLYEPEFVEDLLQLAEKYARVDLFFAWHSVFNRDGIVNIPYKLPEYQSQIEWMYSAFCMRREYQAQCGMVRLSALRSIGGFADLLAAWPSDLVTWTRLAVNGMVTSQRVLMHWRYDGQNISSCKKENWSLWKIDSVLSIRSEWLKEIEGARAKSEEDIHLLKSVLRRMTGGYIDWFVFQELPRLSLRAKLRVLNRLQRDKLILKRRAIRLAIKFLFAFNAR